MHAAGTVACAAPCSHVGARLRPAPTARRRPLAAVHIAPRALGLYSSEYAALYEGTRVLGEAVCLFTGVYCGLNWVALRRMRRDADDASAAAAKRVRKEREKKTRDDSKPPGE